MATNALDLSTVLKIFHELKEECKIGKNGWKTSNHLQQEVMDFFEKFSGEIPHWKDLNCSYEFSEGPWRISVKSILDKRVKWIGGKAEDAIIIKNNVEYPSFRLKNGCSVFSTTVSPHPLLKISTKSGDNLWLVIPDKELKGMDLVRFAFAATQSIKHRHVEYVRSPDALIPKIDFSLEPNISFLAGISTSKSGENWFVEKATQKFKFRMNEEGARAVVETCMMLFGSCAREVKKKETVIIDQPFVGWFTQANSVFPMAVFYADLDSWKAAGSLDEL